MRKPPFLFTERPMNLWKKLSRPANTRKRDGNRRFRPAVEALEDRRVMTIAWVNPTGGVWDDPGNWFDPVAMVHRVPNNLDNVSWGLPGETLTVVNNGGCANFSLGAFS